MAELSDEDVQAILTLFEDSDFDYLEFQQGDLKLSVAKRGYVPAAQAVAPAPMVAPVAVAATEPAPAPEPAEETPAAAPPPADTAADTKDREGLVAVTAPMVGTFYAAPDPQSPAYVTLGATVDADATVGLIEVMKVFTGIQAGATGEIAEILVENAAMVQQGDVLFYIKPAG